MSILSYDFIIELKDTCTEQRTHVMFNKLILFSQHGKLENLGPYSAPTQFNNIRTKQWTIALIFSQIFHDVVLVCSSTCFVKSDNICVPLHESQGQRSLSQETSPITSNNNQ